MKLTSNQLCKMEESTSLEDRGIDIDWFYKEIALLKKTKRKSSSIKYETMKKYSSMNNLTENSMSYIDMLVYGKENVIFKFCQNQSSIAEMLREIRDSYCLDTDKPVNPDMLQNMLIQLRKIAKDILDLLQFTYISIKKLKVVEKIVFQTQEDEILCCDLQELNFTLVRLPRQDSFVFLVQFLKKLFERFYLAKSTSIWSYQSVLRSSVHSNPNIKRTLSSPMFQSGKSFRKEKAPLITIAKRDDILSDMPDEEPILKSIDKMLDRFDELVPLQRISDYYSSYTDLNLDNITRNVLEDEEDVEEIDKYESETSLLENELEYGFSLCQRTNLYIALFLTLLQMMNIYVIAPTSGKYAQELGQSSSLSGVIMGLSPLAACISAIYFAYWTNYSYRSPIIMSILCGVIENLLYSMALPWNSLFFLFIGRLISGWGGSRGIARRYIMEQLSQSHSGRLFASTQFVNAGAIGLALGPCLASLLSFFNYSIVLHSNSPAKRANTNLSGTNSTSSIAWESTSVSYNTVIIQFNEVTGPGWMMCVLWLFSLIIVFRFFQEVTIPSCIQSQTEKQADNDNREISLSLLNHGKSNKNDFENRNYSQDIEMKLL